MTIFFIMVCILLRSGPCSDQIAEPGLASGQGNVRVLFGPVRSASSLTGQDPNLRGASMTEPVRFDRHTLVLLRLRPDAPRHTPEQAAELQDRHLAYLAGRVAAGEILAVGPPVDQDDVTLRGLSVWSVGPDRARELCSADPAVLAGRLAVEVASWLVPAGMLSFHPVRVPRSTADV
jgi:uncharacterized protein